MNFNEEFRKSGPEQIQESKFNSKYESEWFGNGFVLILNDGNRNECDGKKLWPEMNEEN